MTMEKNGLNQTQLAAQLVIDSSYVSRILKGERINLSQRVLGRLEELERRGATSQSMTQSQDIHRPRAEPEEPIWPRGSYSHGGARLRLRSAREQAKISREKLAQLTGYSVGVIQAMEDTGARISEKMAEKLAEHIPGLEKRDLLDGSDYPSMVAESSGTVGATPSIRTPSDVVARYVPLISWAQCGAITDFEDLYEYEGQLAFNVQDPRALAITLKGDSMEPRFREGDIAVVYPSRKPQTGNLVIAKIKDEGVVFKRFQILSSRPPRFRFISENPNYEPIDRNEDEIDWIYPVANIVNNVL